MTILTAIDVYIKELRRQDHDVKSVDFILYRKAFELLCAELHKKITHPFAIYSFDIMGVTVRFKSFEGERIHNLERNVLFDSILMR